MNGHGSRLTPPFCHSGARVSANPESFSTTSRFAGTQLRTIVRCFASPRNDRRSHQEHALAVDLLVEQLVGLLGLVELPAMGEELIDIDAALDRETRAFGLDDIRERPGCDQRQLPAEQ